LPPYFPEDWPSPEPLSDGLKPVEPFSYELLPERIRPWVEDISDRMQCPPDFPGVGAMVVLAALIGRKIGVYPKLHDEWFVVVNLWGLFVGRPSEMKTPVLNEITKPLKKLEAEAKKIFEEAEKEYAAATRRAKLQEELVLGEAKKALKSGTSPATVDRLFMDLDDSIGEIPYRKRYIVNDATVEKLGVLLNENPNGLLLIRDEVSGWLSTINRGDRPNDRAFYLEACSGSHAVQTAKIMVAFEAVCEKERPDLTPGALLRVATKFPNVATRHFKSRGIAVEMIFVQGSVELAPLTGLADVIVDIVETGETLRQNGLEVVEDICEVSSVVVANRVGLKLKRAAIAPLLEALAKDV